MSYSYTAAETKAFTLTHARHLAAKIAADLKRIQRFYGEPDEGRIARLEAEVIELLRLGYLETVIYGFKRDGDWIEPTLRYVAKDLANGDLDDSPGQIHPSANVEGASFHSFLHYSSTWWSLTPDQQGAIRQRLPFQRTEAPESKVKGGYFANDKTYSSGGRQLDRSSVRSY